MLQSYNTDIMLWLHKISDFPQIAVFSEIPSVSQVSRCFPSFHIIFLDFHCFLVPAIESVFRNKMTINIHCQIILKEHQKWILKVLLALMRQRSLSVRWNVNYHADLAKLRRQSLMQCLILYAIWMCTKGFDCEQGLRSWFIFVCVRWTPINSVFACERCYTSLGCDCCTYNAYMWHLQE